MEMRDEFFSSVQAREVNTSASWVSHLEDIVFQWEDLDLNMHSLSTRHRLSFITFTSTTNDFDEDSLVENAILSDIEEANENYSSSTPVSEQQNEFLPGCREFVFFHDE